MPFRELKGAKFLNVNGYTGKKLVLNGVKKECEPPPPRIGSIFLSASSCPPRQGTVNALKEPFFSNLTICQIRDLLYTSLRSK